MSSRGRAVVFGLLTLAWIGLGLASLASGKTVMAVVDFVAAAATAAFTYRTLRPPSSKASRAESRDPRNRPKDQVKELRAPRPRK